MVCLAYACDRNNVRDSEWSEDMVPENMLPVLLVVFAENLALVSLAGAGLTIGSRCHLNKIRSRNDFFNQPGATDELWSDRCAAVKYQSSRKLMKVSAISQFDGNISFGLGLTASF